MTVYTLFGQAGGGTISDDTDSYTLGMQFTLSEDAELTGIWFYSAAEADGLPVQCEIYEMTGTGTGSVVPGSQNLSPSWSGAAGSGWVKCSYASGPVLSAETVYKVTVDKDNTAYVYSATSHYWDTGPGAGGLTVGIITAPDNAGGDGGQDTFAAGEFGYPDSSFNATNYWVDVEVTTSGGTPHTATAALTVTPSFSAVRARGTYRTAALTVTPSFTAGRQRGKYRTGSLTVVPSFSAARARGHYRTGALEVIPVFAAVRIRGHYRSAALVVTPSFRATGAVLPPARITLWTVTGARQLWSAGTARQLWITGTARN